MNSNLFTKDIIRQLVLLFPYLKCYYEFDELFNTHYLQIEPKKEFDNNEELNNHLDNIYYDFIEKFPSESIAFSTNNSNVVLANISFELEGKEFESDLKHHVWNLKKIQVKTLFEINSCTDDEFYLEDEYFSAA